MDVQLALKDLGIRSGLKGYTRKSSTFSHMTVIGGLWFYCVLVES